MTIQLDLFGDVEHQLSDERAHDQQRADWLARFERADWIAPWDCADGTPKGTVKSGWRCPDPTCGQVAPNSYLLHINHGFDPTVPGEEPYHGRCWKAFSRHVKAVLDLVAQERYAQLTAPTDPDGRDLVSLSTDHGNAFYGLPDGHLEAIDDELDRGHLVLGRCITARLAGGPQPARLLVRAGGAG